MYCVSVFYQITIVFNTHRLILIEHIYSLSSPLRGALRLTSCSYEAAYDTEKIQLGPVDMNMNSFFPVAADLVFT